MKTVLITGARGFIGRNLAALLRCRDDVRILEYDLANSESELRDWAAQADVIVHLAGVNRPQNVEDFETGNAGFTQRLCQLLRELGRRPLIIASSSIQSALDNPYGLSKRHAEAILEQFAANTGAAVAVFRLKNVFGKWSAPNYNSVVATFCHNAAHDLPIAVNDPSRELELVYVDDVIAAILAEIDRPRPCAAPAIEPDAIPSYRLTLADLAGRIQAFHEMRGSLQVADFTIRFNQQLYATYLSYLNPEQLDYPLAAKGDARGSLAEFIKSTAFGQIFVSRTLPGVTRGSHYHHTRTEKFFVIAGEGLIRFRQLEGTQIHEYRVRGQEYRVLDIPPGYTHSITNVGREEMITLFWASEIFDPDRPDTFFLPVDNSSSV